MGRRLERHIDGDLVDRILANGPIKKPSKIKSNKKPREATTYRGARRNSYRGSVWPGVKARRQHGFAKLLNRSERRPAAKSYEHAREISPSAEPVR